MSRPRLAPVAGVVLGVAATIAGPLLTWVPTAAAFSPETVDVGRRPAPIGPSATPSMRATLQRRLDRLRAREEMPGVSVAILFPDGTTWLGTSGLADVGNKRKVTPETAFALASVTKTFTAALIMSLRDEGKLALDMPVVHYLPSLRIDKRITVRELLDHTSGLRDFFFGPGIDHALLSDRGRTWTAARSMRYVRKTPYFKPGKGWHYSNTNYLILGMIAERVGQGTLEDQLRARFLDPLGLSHTYDQVDGKPKGPVAHGYRFAETSSRPIDLSDGSKIAPFTSVITAAGGAGSLASTPSDLVHWVRALYSGVVVSPDSLRMMFADVARTARKDALIPYGLGVQAIELDGHPAYGHSGRLLGFRSIVRWLPAERIAIAVLTNTSRTDPTHHRPVIAPAGAAATQGSLPHLPRAALASRLDAMAAGAARYIRLRGSGTDGSFPAATAAGTVR